MMAIHAFIAASVICFDGRCYPVLMGDTTPVGHFTLHHQFTSDPGYGGDILVFKESDTFVWAVHRTWPGREDMYALKPAKRRAITNGCINVVPEIFDRIRLHLAVDNASIFIVHAGRPGADMFEARHRPRMAKAVRSVRAKW